MWLRFAAILVLVMCNVCVFAQTDTVSIARVKDMLERSDKDAGKQEFVIKGYFFKDPLPLLMSDKKWARINMPMPDSVYLVIGGPLKDSFHLKYQGLLLRVTGLIEYAQAINGRPQFIVTAPPTILSKK